MIEGLKVTLTATELKALCLKRALHHHSRAKTYAQQAETLETAGVAMNELTQHTSMNNDPKKALLDRGSEHEMLASELSFIADHLDPAETYVLSRSDLYRLGIAKKEY